LLGLYAAKLSDEDFLKAGYHLGGELLQMPNAFSSSNPRVKRKYITDSKVAGFFVDSRNLHILDAFVGEEGKTLSCVAEMLRVEVGSLYYKAKKMEAYGILEVTKEEKRAGRAIKYYRLSAEEFFLPLELSPFESVEGYIRATFSSLHELVLKNAALAREREWEGQWGISLIENKRDHELDRRLQPDPPQPEVVRTHYLGYRTLHLSSEQAKELAKRLELLAREYENVPAEGTPHIIYLAVTPH
jgi:hypothetical protein